VAPNSFAKEYIESRFGDLLSRALAELCGDGCALAVAVGRVGEG
jgi:chromosomal replication initiation ATPase DnaA